MLSPTKSVAPTVSADLIRAAEEEAAQAMRDAVMKALADPSRSRLRLALSSLLPYESIGRLFVPGAGLVDSGFCEMLEQNVDFEVRTFSSVAGVCAPPDYVSGGYRGVTANTKALHHLCKFSLATTQPTHRTQRNKLPYST